MKSIKSTIIGTAVLITLVIFAAQTGFAFLQFRGTVAGEIENVLRIQVEKEAMLLNSRLTAAGMHAVSFANNITAMQKLDINIILRQMEPFLRQDELVYGGGIWFEPYKYDRRQYVGPYLYKDGDQIVQTWDYSEADYDYPQWDWYKNGLKGSHMVNWTGPFYDEISSTTMISATTPIKHNGQVIGVTSCDIVVDSLAMYVSNDIRVGEKGFAFLVTGDGTIMAHRDQSLNQVAKITELSGYADVSATILMSRECGLEQVVLDGIGHYVAFVPVGNTGMHLLTVLPVSETVGAVSAFLQRSVSSLILAMAFFAAMLYLLIDRTVTRPLLLLVNNADAVANGNLTLGSSMTSAHKNEIGRLTRVFGRMIENMNSLVKDIAEKSQIVMEAASQLNDSADQTASGASQTAGIMSDMTHDVSEVAESIRRISTSSEDTSTTALKGSSEISEVTHQMAAIAQATNEASAVIDGLNQHISSINSMVELIKGVASQTNLLSLNAAIEAARAGEHGRGFAVVAAEVKVLAEQTAKATQDITRLIAGIQAESAKVVNIMATSVEQVRTGTIVVRSTRDVFDQIITAVKNFSGQAEGVVAATNNMSHGIESVAAATEELTASNEEVLAAASSLMRLSEELAASVARFKVK